MKDQEARDLGLPTDLEEMVNIIACETVGHRKGPWQEYTYTSLEPVGKSFRWRECLRCGATASGERPRANSAISEMFTEVYKPEVMMAEFWKSRAVYDYLKGTSWLQ
jgi:hypothetical protein